MNIICKMLISSSGYPTYYTVWEILIKTVKIFLTLVTSNELIPFESASLAFVARPIEH